MLALGVVGRFTSLVMGVAVMIARVSLLLYCVRFEMNIYVCRNVGMIIGTKDEGAWRF